MVALEWLSTQSSSHMETWRDGLSGVSCLIYESGHKLIQGVDDRD